MKNEVTILKTEKILGLFVVTYRLEGENFNRVSNRRTMEEVNKAIQEIIDYKNGVRVVVNNIVQVIKFDSSNKSYFKVTPANIGKIDSTHSGFFTLKQLGKNHEQHDKVDWELAPATTYRSSGRAISYPYMIRGERGYFDTDVEYPRRRTK